MPKKIDITPDVLRERLDYDAMSGKLFWKARSTEGTRGDHIFNALYAGKEAFTCQMGKKHRQGRIHNVPLLAHRVVWAIVHGAWPTGQIDHINGNPIDNRISNLRDIPSAENQKNMKRPCTNTSGVAGVSWRPNRGKWRARIMTEGKEVCLGHFKEFGDAVQARADALERYGYHPNHGRGA